MSAGWDQNVAPGTDVLLDASYSSDTDGEIISYLWDQTNGPGVTRVTLSDPKTMKPTFVSPGSISDQTGLEFRLTVTDDGGLKSSDTVTIYVSEIIRVGDVNGDKTVDLQDVILTLKILSGMNRNDIHTDAEVNGDGKIGTEELIYMLQFVSELREDLSLSEP